MNTYFTPGPWLAPHFADDAHSCDCVTVVSEGYAGGICTVHIDNGLRIGEGGNDAPPLEEAKANARVIAAAPDTLAALKEIVSQIDQGGSEGKVFARDACIARARAEIAKAEGRP